MLILFPTSPEDYEQAITLLNEVFKDYVEEQEKYTAQIAFERTKDKKDAQIIVIYEDNQPAAFTLIYERIPNYLHIWQQGVLKEHRKKGLASQMYEYIEKYAKDNNYKGTTLNTSNKYKDSLRLAIKNGYEIYELEHNDKKPNNPKIKLKKEFSK